MHIVTPTPRVYSDTRTANGPLLFISGQVPIADDGTVPADIAGQTLLVVGRSKPIWRRTVWTGVRS
jgi:2-iminobutanoate/2-iminopropanoate deaminase